MIARGTIAALFASAALAGFATPGFAFDHTYMRPASHVYSEPIIVTEPKWSTDETITRGVVDALESDPRLAGRIGVQTTDGEVELSGIVTSAGLSRQAERDAKAVYGVRNVQNKLATLIGGGRY